MSLLPRLLKTFYRAGVPALPIVDGQGIEPGNLIGFITREQIDREMSDLDRARQELDRIPASLYTRHRLTDSQVSALTKLDRVPVLSEAGDQVAAWDTEQLLAAIHRFNRERAPLPARATTPKKENTKPKKPEAAGEESTRTGKRWLGELVLGAIPHALFASDLEGNTLFYNNRFEERVLGHPKCKGSIRIAEQYILELMRDVLARSFDKPTDFQKQSDFLRTYSQSLGLLIHVANLEEDERIHGYLYFFLDPTEDLDLEPELRERLGEQGLDGVLDDFESRIIYSALAEHGQNISHTARALKLKRSTLQNKMKRLRIDERFDRQVDGPIRRHRRTRAELEAEGDVEKPPAAKAKKKTAKRAQKKRSRSGATSKKASKKKKARKKVGLRKKPAAKKSASRAKKKTRKR